MNIGLFRGGGIITSLIKEKIKKEKDLNIIDINLKKYIKGNSIDIYKIKEELEKKEIKKVILLSKVDKKLLINANIELKVKREDLLLNAVEKLLNQWQIELISAKKYLKEYFLEEGIFGYKADEQLKELSADIKWSFYVAVHLSKLFIAQVVAVKNGVILAIEGADGTNATIERAYNIGGEGIVVAKAGYPNDYELATIGKETISLLKKYKAAALVVEANNVLFIEKEELLKEAASAKLIIVSAKEDQLLEK